MILHRVSNSAAGARPRAIAHSGILGARLQQPMPHLHITDIEAAINWWRERSPSPDGITACAEGVLGGTCPNCAGELLPRPRRPAAKLAANPASNQRVFKPAGCAKLAAAA